MLRRLQVGSGKSVDAMCTARSAMVKGMIVTRDITTKLATLPTAATNLFFVTRENIPTGLMTAEGELSDYDTRFETIAMGSQVLLEKPVASEIWATDQYVADGLVDGDYLVVETNVNANQGKLIKSAGATEFVYKGTIKDCGHTLAVVEVI